MAQTGCSFQQSCWTLATCVEVLIRRQPDLFRSDMAAPFLLLTSSYQKAVIMQSDYFSGLGYIQGIFYKRKHLLKGEVFSPAFV